MQKTYTIVTTYLLFPILFLVFFQLWGAIISILTSSFTTLLALSISLSLITASTIAYHLRRSFTVTRVQLGIIFSLSTIGTFLFSLRLNWNIFDYHCPTAVLNLVSQVADGKFPASFISFPEFAMNYHQGFIFTAGVVSYFGNIAPSMAVYFTLLACYFLLTTYLPLFFVSIKNHFYYLPPLLFIFVTSLDLHTLSGINFGWYNYISIFEYSGSNSWPLSLLLLTVWLFFIYQYTHTIKNILVAAALTLAVATLNATLFSAMVLTVPLIAIYYWWATKKFPYRHFVLSASLLILVFIIPRFLPSAFLIGQYYDTPQYGIRLLYDGLDKYLKHTARFIVLCGPLILVSALAVYTILRRRIIDWRIYPAALFVVAFCFPFLFGFANVDVWDNIHKFAVISMYVGAVLTVAFIGDSILSRKILLSYLALCVLVSLPALYDIATVRLSTDYTHQLYPVAHIADITNHLQGTNKTILPYKIDAYELCDDDAYIGIANHSGNLMENAYYQNFLLAPTIEATYKDTLRWTESTSTISTTIASLDADTVLVVNRKWETEFLQILEDTNTPPDRHLTYFKYFLLYE